MDGTGNGLDIAPIFLGLCDFSRKLQAVGATGTFGSSFKIHEKNGIPGSGSTIRTLLHGKINPKD